MNAGVQLITPIYVQPSDDITTRRDDIICARAPPGFAIVGNLFEMQRTSDSPPIIELSGELLRSPEAHAVTALVQAKAAPKGTPPPSVGMGRVAKLTGVEILRRMHVVLGHPSLPVLLATLMASKDINAHIITKADIEQYVREACGICESAKMRRESFRAVTDPTPVPVGKKWVFDTMHMQVPSCQGKYLYITRFVNKLTGSPGFKRLYGHIAFTSETLIGLCQRLRAFVRPIHGEIMIFKHDSLPAQESKEMVDYMTEITVQDQSSPPYCHEGVGEVEVTWQWDVPSAMALLMGRDDELGHFYTAFMTVEKASNRVIVPGTGKSRDMVFYDRDAPLPMSCMLAYGSPVKYLLHPEVRDSKFDDHALPGIYRGPSHEDESDHRCLVQAGTGAVMRHVTVDTGCIRVDERSVIARTDRNHPSHQPFAIDPSPPAP
jgi:hypothetical protein